MTLQEKYLILYRSYETLLRDAGKDPRLVEQEYETSNPGHAARLRMCRLFRNYLTHENDPGFLEPNDRMMDFLSGIVTELQIQGDSVKKHTKPAGNYIFEDSMKCGDVLAKMIGAKTDIAVRHSKTGYDLCSIHDILALYMASKASKLAAAKALRTKVIIAAPTDKFTGLDSSRVTICTVDGTPEGKLVGYVKF